MAAPAPPLAAEVLTRLTRVYGAARDPARAVPMAAYLRDQFPFLGIPAPAQKALARQVATGLARPTATDLHEIALGCWALPEREYQYFACGLLRRHAGVCGPDFIDTARQLVTTKPWWDTVDALAAHLVGPLVRRHPALVAVLDEWIGADDIWLVRTALLHQLTFQEETDAARLFGYCSKQAGHRDFFVRKAIGWALRQYARTDPAAVRAYLREHRSRLSALSAREAGRRL